MNELIELISKKLGLAIEFVGANFEDVFARYVKYEVGTCIVALTIFSILFLLAVTYMCVLIKSYYKSKKSKESNILIDYNNDIWIDLSILGGVLLFFAVALLLLGFIGIPLCIRDIIGWLKVPEIMALKALEVL